MSRYIDLAQIEFLKVDGNKEFNHGVDCCINILLEAEPIKTIPLVKVKQAREEIDELDGEFLTIYDGTNKLGSGKYVYIEEVLEILDKLIESEVGE